MQHTQVTSLTQSGGWALLCALLVSLSSTSLHTQSAATRAVNTATAPSQQGVRLDRVRQTDSERILTVGGGITEIVFALGKGRSVVATDTSSYFPNRAKQLPKIGTQHSLVAANILALEPTLVLLSAEAGPALAIKQLQDFGIQVEQLNQEPSLQGLLQRIKRIGQLLGESERALVLSNDVRRAFAAIDSQKQLLEGDPPRVLFVMQHRDSAPVVAGSGTTIDTLIRLSGALNAASDKIGFTSLSTEAMVALDPEIILTTEQTLERMGGEDYLWRVPGLGRTRAGREQNLVVMDALLLMGFSIRSPVATKELLSTWQTLMR